MRKNRIVSIVVVPDKAGADVALYRANNTVRSLPDTGSATRRVLDILSAGAYSSTISHAINPNTGYSYIVSITYKPMMLSESKYREVLRAVYLFFHKNIDGLLEDNKGADYLWHLLGSISAYPHETWTPMKHREEFCKSGGVTFKKAWESFFDDPRGY